MRKLLLPLFVAGLVVSTPLMSHAADNTEQAVAESTEQTIVTEVTEEAVPSVFNAEYGTWQRSGNRYWFRFNDGSYAHDEVGEIDGVTYAFDENGWMVTGWGYVYGDWYYCNGSGAVQFGWQYIGGKWYYLDPVTGQMWGNGKNEEFYIEGDSYYFCADGSLAEGWYYVDFELEGPYWIYCRGGQVHNGWEFIDGYWYYSEELNSIGRPMWFTDQVVKIDGVMYAFDSESRMITGWGMVKNFWYYCNRSGVMQFNWQYIGGKWYYLDQIYGYMHAHSWYEDYYLLSSGAMADGWVKENGEWYYYPGGKDYTGWLASGGNWYYIINNEMIYNVPILEFGNLKGPEYAYGFDQNGIMIKGWHHFSFEQEDGTMFNEWYYYQPNGLVADGWIKSGNNWYFCVYGQMLHGTTYKTGENEVSRFDDNGIWTGYVE